MTCKEAINKLDKNIYYCVYDALDDLEIIKEIDLQDICKHRWEEYGTLIVQLEDGYIGISGITMMFNEVDDPANTNNPVTYCEYEISGYKPIFSPKETN